jgi:hypothetical protein
MTSQTPVERLRADLADAERELDHVDAVGDTAAAVRVRMVLGPRIDQLRRALAAAERDRRTTTEVQR